MDYFPLTEIMAKRAKKRNFSDTEIEVLVGEVETNQKLLFGTLNAGVTNKRKSAAWEKVTAAVNSVRSEERSLSEKKKNCLISNSVPKNASQPTQVVNHGIDPSECFWGSGIC